MATKNYKLDKEEFEIEKKIANGEYTSIKNFDAEKNKYQNLAKAHGNKVKRVNLRMTTWDYEKAQEKALREGLPYQTFLASILHKYLSDQFVEQSVH